MSTFLSASIPGRADHLPGELIAIVLTPRAPRAVRQLHTCAVLMFDFWALRPHGVVEPHQVASVLSLLALMGAILSRSIVGRQHKTARIVEAERGAAHIRVIVRNIPRRHVLVVAFLANKRLCVIKVFTLLLLNLAVLLIVSFFLRIFVILTRVVGSPIATPFPSLTAATRCRVGWLLGEALHAAVLPRLHTESVHSLLLGLPQRSRCLQSQCLLRSKGTLAELEALSGRKNTALALLRLLIDDLILHSIVVFLVALACIAHAGSDAELVHP